MNVFINLPIADLPRSRAFFTTLGFSFNDNFSDETALGMTISDTVFAMLLTHAKFKDFTPHAIADSTKTTEVLLALQLDSREAVDRIMEQALSAGGSEPRPPQEHGFMYGRSFADPDGHIWEPFWMDPTAMPGTE